MPGAGDARGPSASSGRPGYGWVSFTTDYGTVDGFVAACHGVIASLAPTARVIDVTHQVPPGDIRRGAAVLADTVPHLPPAIHLAVVDPGVGTRRRAVAVTAGESVLVGPDNGLLMPAAEALGGVVAAAALDNPDWHRRPVSRTFHGRDIFAPVAARLAAGEPLAQAGAAIETGSLVRLPEPVVRRGQGWLESEVLTVDRFGNLQLAAVGGDLIGLTAGERSTADGLAMVGPAAASSVTVAHADRTAVAVVGGTFADAANRAAVVLVDSTGRVAVAVNGGRAADLLAAGPGDLLRLQVTGPHGRG